MSIAYAHEPEGPDPYHFGWSFEPWAVIPIVIVACLYFYGTQRMGGTADRRVQHGLFWIGLTTIALALTSPLHQYGEHLFSAHMIEHEILMVVGAPLLVAARPGVILMAGMPSWAKKVTLSIVRNNATKWTWRGLTELWSATLLHTAVIWLWHVPVLFQAAVDHEGIHILQHLSFIVSALFFWQAILDRDHRRYAQGMAAGALFLTSLQASVLGALITFARQLWYPGGTDPFPIIGLTRYEDQSLAGLIMWVPACTIYVIAAVAVLARWITRMEMQHG